MSASGRIIDIASEPATLRLSTGCVLVQRREAPDQSIPLAEVAVLVLSNGLATCTSALLGALASAGASVVVCDDRSMPCGLLLPIEAHSTQAERFRVQAGASRPTTKRIWRHVVQQKLRMQAALLRAVIGTDGGIEDLVSTVRSGDPGNVEAYAAGIYWPLLFGDSFRRRRDVADQNRYLNYGYAVARAIVARAICGAGLHPSLGVHHHNRYNAYCLADDLLEPYRPIVDGVVYDAVGVHGADAALDRSVKQSLIEPLLSRFECDGENRSLFDLATRTCVSLAAVLEGRAKRVWFPSPEVITNARDPG